jgi:hypothetical protein
MAKKEDKSWLDEKVEQVEHAAGHVADAVHPYVDRTEAALAVALATIENATKAAVAALEAAAKKAAPVVADVLVDAAVETIKDEIVNVFSTRPGTVNTAMGELKNGQILKVTREIALDLIKQFPKHIRLVN